MGVVAAGVAAAGAAATIGAAVMSSQAAKDAASTQANAALTAAGMQQAQQQQTRSDLLPYNTAGQNALQQLQFGLGTGGYPGQNGTPATPGYAAGTLPPGYSIQDVQGGGNSVDWSQAQAGPNGTVMIGGVQYNSDGTPVGGGGAGSNGFTVRDASGNVVGTYPAGTDRASVLAQFPGASATAATPGAAAPSGYGALTAPFNMSPEALAQTPGYQFNLKQGQQAVTNSNAARGLGVSGAALRSAGEYALGLADSTWQAQANNYYTGQNNAYNKLIGTSQLGENAAATTGAQGTIAAQNAGNNIVGAGAANAAGIIGSANALSGIGSAIQNGYNSYQQNQLFQSLTNNNNGIYGSSIPAYGSSGLGAGLSGTGAIGTGALY